MRTSYKTILDSPPVIHKLKFLSQPSESEYEPTQEEIEEIKNYVSNSIFSADKRNEVLFQQSIQSIIKAIEDTDSRIIPFVYTNDYGTFLINCLQNLNDPLCIACTLDLILKFSLFLPDIYNFFSHNGMFQAALHFITSGDFNITLYCIQVINCFMETVTSLPFDLHSLINSYRQIVMLSPKHELYVSESIVMIITYIDFTHYLHPLLDLLYQILDSHPTEQTVKYSITSLNLLMGCNDRYYDDILYRGLDDPIKKLVGREDLNHTNSEFIEPLLSFISKVVFLIDGPKSDILIKKIGYFDALYALFHNHNIEKARSLVLDIFIQVIEKELDTIYFKICYRLIEYLVEKNFILELFSIFEDSNFDIKVNIIRFFKVIMSSKLHKMYQKMVEEDHLNYFDVCGSFCVSCMDPEIFKWFLETMINIWEVAEQLDEVGIISEKSEELNEQIAEFVHNNKEEELMKLAEMYFNQISKDEEEEAE